MLKLESFIQFKNNNKIDTIIKQASKFECDTLNTETFMHKTLHKIKDTFFKEKIKNQIDIYQTIVKVETFFKYTPNIKNDYYYNNILKNLDCGVYRYIDNKYHWNCEYLIQNIANSMEENKIIFIILDFEDYGLDSNNNYEAHSTVLLFLPCDKKKYFNYNCYYINSHGINSLEDNFYEYKLSSKRKKKCKLNKPFDFKFIEILVNYLNKNTLYKIKYSKEHNYLGANLQAGDSRGVCFMYPIVVFYYFGKYYYNERFLKINDKETINIKSGYNLIENNKLNLFIESMFIDFCTDFKMMLFEKIKYPNIDFTKFLIEIIEKKKILYCKIILRTIVNFISQFK